MGLISLVNAIFSVERTCALMKLYAASLGLNVGQPQLYVYKLYALVCASAEFMRLEFLASNFMNHFLTAHLFDNKTAFMGMVDFVS